VAITEEERAILDVIRLNKAAKRKEITRKFNLGNLRITFNWRSKSNLWGRFGGGWNWELGFVAGGSTLILNLLVFSLRFHWAKDGH